MLLRRLLAVLGASLVAASCPVEPACSVRLKLASGAVTVRGALIDRQSHPSQIILVCPQVAVFPNATLPSEDCLYAVVYAPVTSQRGKSLPVLSWLHGGSLTYGGASDGGLDGSKFVKKGVVTVVLQYRLGVLGLLQPLGDPSADDPNLAVRDLVRGLKFIRAHARSFGGDKDRLTLAGHSSGAYMVRRALWATPAAKGLVSKMILQSDPFIYGLAPKHTTASLQVMLSKALGCADTACLRALPIEAIITAQVMIANQAPATIPGIPLMQPFRPTFGTPTIPSDPLSSLFSDPCSLSLALRKTPLMITTVADEGGQNVGGMFPTALPANEQLYVQFLTFMLGSRTPAARDAYPLTAGQDMRITVSKAMTDGGWRCPARAVAAKWAAAGGTVYLGEFTRGSTHWSNARSEFCAGRVCHQDDIYATFGTSPDPSAFSVTDIWVQFIKSGKPGRWKPFPTTDDAVDAIKALGGGTLGNCPAGVWGGSVPWDWQIYV